MKKTLLIYLIIALLGCIGKAGATENPTEESVSAYFDVGNPVKFGGEDYYLAWSSRPYDFYVIQEYLPKGEAFENYTRMFTVCVMFVGDAPFDSTKAVELKIAELEETKKTDPVCNYLVAENDGEYILDFIVSKSDDKGDLEFVEADIHYYRDIEINGIKANYLLFYSCRAYGDDIKPFMESIPGQREKWYRDITGLDIMPKFRFKEQSEKQK